MKIAETQPRLLIPMDIEALVIGEAASKSQWVDLRPDFAGVYYNLFLGAKLEREACTDLRENLLDPGIHLHWALPDGLMHGSARENGGDLQFPMIPNRWLVVRFWNQADNSSGVRFQHKAWIVESNSITDDKTAPTWPSLNVSNPNSKKPEDYYVRVGKQFELAQWPGGESPAASVDITSIGYGDPAFAAYYPACKGILGFHDQDLEKLQDATVNYFVCGWYSKPADDPLYQALSQAPAENVFPSLDAFLSERKWTYAEFIDTLEKAKETANPKEMEALQNSLPAQIICHGVISGIQLKKDTLCVPRSQPSNLSFGNTAAEALTALFRSRLANHDLARLLEAFQYDLLTELEKPDGEAIVEQKLHERRYRPLSRGIRWELIQEDPSVNGGASEAQAPPIPGDICLLLEKLNIRQRLTNSLKRKRDSLRSQLYATWYKRALKAGKDPAAEKILNQELTDLQNEIDAITGEIARNEKELTAGESDLLREQLKIFLPGYGLQELEEPRFWRPNDPVVLLAGKAFQRSSRHGEDGRYRKDERLLCRLSAQEIVKLKITVPFAKKVDVEFGSAEIDAWCNPFPQPRRHDLPAAIVDLFRESLLLTLDAKRAGDIAQAAYEKNEAGLAKDHPQEIAKLSRDLLRCLEELWHDAGNPEIEDLALRRGVKDANGQTAFEFVGRFPSPIMIKNWEQNPWLPLFLQWQVTWEPAYTEPLQALKDWALNPGGTGFKWQGNGRSGKSQIYSGTTLLTPSATLHLSNRLRDYMLTHTGVDTKLKAFQAAVSSMDILCQSLGGLTENLLARKGRLELRPLDPGANGRAPQPSPIFDKVKEIDWLSPLTDGGFFPVRAGRLRVEALWIIDAFGQLLQLDSESLKKIACAEQLMSSGGYLRLEPRLAQPTRLTIQWLPADRSRWDAISLPDTQAEEFNPICGWIIPNFLDSSLMIYDDRGNALGALQAVKSKSWEQGVGGEHGEIESFHWIDIPGSNSFFFGLPPKGLLDPLGKTANPHLREFVKGLLSLAEGAGQAFSRLLDKINEALSVGAGAGSSQNPNLALLIGKPLALVRASVCLELDGSPARAQATQEPQAERTGRIEAVKFPVRLGDRRRWNDIWIGDDGLVGFFQNQDYTRFFPTYGLKGTDDTYSRYEEVPYISIAEPLDLTLLMDVSRGVCATTGILPRTVFQLPYGDMTEAVESKQVIFFTGPVVSPNLGEEKPEIHMPRPSDIYGQWSWTHHPAVKVWSEGPIVEAEAEDGYFSDPPMQIAEGWLKLVTAPLSIRVFTVRGKNAVGGDTKKPGEAATPDQFLVEPGETVLLSWATVGADSVELFVELFKDGGVSLFKSSRHPLPTQYQIQVDQNASFTLIATARAAGADKAPEKKETKTIDLRLKQSPRA